MARIRTIKPEFFTSEDIVTMTPLARLFYVSLWCEADREGRLEWKPGTFKMRYLPGDNCDVAELGKELIANDLIVIYSVDGKTYAEIPTFTEHQVINNREADSSIPARGNQPKPINLPERVPSGVNLTPATRETVIARDGGKCLRCGSSIDLTVDHIFPQSLGGTHALKNLRCLCRKCNSARPVSGSALLADLAMDELTLLDMDSYCFNATARVKDASTRVQAEGKEGREGRKGREGMEGVGSDLQERRTDDSPVRTTAKRRQQIQDGFYPDEAGLDKAREKGLSVAVQLTKFVDYHVGKGSVMADWQAAWRTWIGNARPDGPNANQSWMGPGSVRPKYAAAAAAIFDDEPTTHSETIDV